jgi:hypothetical protein
MGEKAAKKEKHVEKNIFDVLNEMLLPRYQNSP